MQHTEDCKLFLQRDVGGGGRRAQALDALGHAGAGRLECPDSSLSDEGVAEFTALAALTAKATKSTASEMTSLFATGYGIYKGSLRW